eukprot:6176638-Pleurochrysis_carterae.AAC.7
MSCSRWGSVLTVLASKVYLCVVAICTTYPLIRWRSTQGTVRSSTMCSSGRNGMAAYQGAPSSFFGEALA